MATSTTVAKDFEFKGVAKSASLGAVVLGVVGLGVSFALNPAVGWVDYLSGALWATTISASAIFFLAVTGVLQASWMTPYKRVPEAMTTFLPVAAVLMAVVILGMHTLYEWTHADVVANDPILSSKTWWLTVNGWIGRLAVIFLVWNFLAWKYRSYSDHMDANGWTSEHTQKIVRFSCIALILFALSICVAAFDWVMSLEPHWFSTIFGVYVFAGAFVSGISFVTLVVLFLKDNGYLPSVNDNHLHDLGKWMFGMSTFWAYIWISQYLLIWYANIPEETEYYVLRSHHGWKAVFFANLIINWVFPFFALMSRGAKRSTSRLRLVAVVLLIGHFVDMYLMVAPMVFHHHDAHLKGFGVLQALQLVGFTGLLVFFTGSALTRRKLESVNDPNFAEGAHLHQ